MKSETEIFRDTLLDKMSQVEFFDPEQMRVFNYAKRLVKEHSPERYLAEEGDKQGDSTDLKTPYMCRTCVLGNCNLFDCDNCPNSNSPWECKCVEVDLGTFCRYYEPKPSKK